MNNKSKKKFMQTNEYKKICKEQKKHRGIDKQRFTVAPGVRLWSWPIPEYDDTELLKPEISETEYMRNNFLETIHRDKIMELHHRINKKGRSSE